MAVPEQTPYIEYTANGITTSFALEFDCESKDHLIVLIDNIEPNLDAWSLSGGAVVFGTAPANGKKITIQRNTPFSRTTDYQAYNNSFRPQSVNGDFNRIWLKLQELGFADLQLNDRIDDVKAFLLAEIEAQGLSLDQLDDYYNYLMQRLAQIAVDKGWDASFVVDGDKNQKQINDAQKAKNSERISVKDFFIEDELDWTGAIKRGDAYCEQNSLTLHFPSGTYFVSESITKSSKTKWVGDGKPNFNITVGSDDKRFMRQGYKHLLGGSNIIWTGSQTDVITLSRDDRFSSFGYMLKTEYFEPNQIQGLGLICDVDCYDLAGNLTTYETDNRANYDVGLVIDNAMDCKFHEIAVFGYFKKKKAMVTVVRNTDASNPDYNFHFDCTYYGGVALIGYQASPNQGLSGSLFNGCSLYDQTYHNRGTTKADDYVDQDVIYIDGQTGTANAINGHKFIGGCIRSTCPTPIKLDRSDDLSIIGVTTECTLNSKYAGQTLNYLSGTINTKKVTFLTNRIGSWYLRLRAFANEITGPFLCDEDGQGTGYIVKGGKGLRYGSPDQLSNDPAIQFSSDFSSFTNGFNLRYSLASDNIQINYNGVNKVAFDNAGNIVPAGRVKKIIGSGGRENRTIAAGVIALTGGSSYVAVAGESSSADDLNTINGGIQGDIIVLTAFSSAQPITVKHNIALIRLSGAVDFVLNNTYTNLTLMYVGDRWIEISRTTLA